jgi:hypothetical protein
MPIAAVEADFTLRWDVPYPPPGFAPADGYRLYARLPGTAWSPIPCAELPLQFPTLWSPLGAPIVAPHKAIAPIRHCSYQPGTVVILGLRGFNATAESVTSNEITVTWPAYCEFSTREQLLSCLGVT